MEVDGLADSITTNAAGFITTRGLYTHSLTNEQISIANWNQNIGNNPFTTTARPHNSSRTLLEHWTTVRVYIAFRQINVDPVVVGLLVEGIPDSLRWSEHAASQTNTRGHTSRVSRFHTWRLEPWEQDDRYFLPFMQTTTFLCSSRRFPSNRQCLIARSKYWRCTSTLSRQFTVWNRFGKNKNAVKSNAFTNTLWRISLKIKLTVHNRIRNRTSVDDFCLKSNVNCLVPTSLFRINPLHLLMFHETMMACADPATNSDSKMWAAFIMSRASYNNPIIDRNKSCRKPRKIAPCQRECLSVMTYRAYLTPKIIL